MKKIMLDEKTIQSLKESGYSFEEIERIRQWVQDVKDGNTIPEEQFWSEVYAEVNAKMKKQQHA